jgi:hypothetical protein
MERRHFLKAAAMGTSAAKNVRIAAVCDVWDENLQNARQIAGLQNDICPGEIRKLFGKLPEPGMFRYSEWGLGEGPRGANFYTHPNGELLHRQGWIDTVRARRQPTAPVEAGVSAASAAQLANQSLREGRVAHYG